MRWIDFTNKKPTDTDIPKWKPWSKDEWNAWLAESKRLLNEMTVLNTAGKIKERDTLIDANASHWGKLKPWLFALSHGKCWFTEGRDICSHKDVEHFRPKKEVENLDGSHRDGYWWLAFDYSNFRASGNVPNRKKGTLFPLHRSSLCSTIDARCEESEDYYLLDPINASDPNLLAFNEEGNAIPAPGVTEWQRERVLISIERLKLNDHDALPSERRKVWREMTDAIDAFRAAKSAYDPTRNPAPRVTMNEKAEYIRNRTRQDAELSSVARWCLLFQNDPVLSELA